MLSAPIKALLKPLELPTAQHERKNAPVAPGSRSAPPGPRAQVQIELHRAQVARQPVGAIQAMGLVTV